MRFYDVGNTNNKGLWVVAPDEETARRIALHKGHVNDPDNARVQDVTEDARESEDIDHLLDGDAIGTAAKRIRAMSGSEMMDMLSGDGPPERHENDENYGWELSEVDPNELPEPS